VPVLRSERAGGPDAGPGLAEHFEHRFRPLSSAVAVPIFAFLSAGVTIGGLSGLSRSLTDPVAVGVVVGLVVGKTLGVLGAAWLVARLTRAALDEDLGWIDVFGVALLSGIGFTVSLLIGELAFGMGTERDDHVKVAVLTGSVSAAVLAAVVLRIRDGVHRRICEAEARDSDHDGTPDVYEAAPRRS
jgi:NhaA family Na+:H+ antiporter